jgi:hypothetical protein
MNNNFLSQEDCAPNVNFWTGAGKVGPTVQYLDEKVPTLRFTVQYQKHWPSGKTSGVGIPCYTSGERVAQLMTWLVPGETVVCQGELSHRSQQGQAGGSLEVYAHRIERLSIPNDQSGRMSQTSRW